MKAATIFPVILPVPARLKALTGREKVECLSHTARRALRLSALAGGYSLGEPLKDRYDVPLPCNGHYWSVSHKPGYVAAVAGPRPMGIDIERICPRNDALLDYVATSLEWELCGGKSWEYFFRYWTAKEAVLKVLGVGLAGLRACQVVELSGDREILLCYGESLYQVEQISYDGHVASVLKGEEDIRWITPEVLRSTGSTSDGSTPHLQSTTTVD